MKVTENFISELSSRFTKTHIGTGKTGYYMVPEVEVNTVLNFLSEYKTSQGADKVDSGKIVNYIRRVNENGELLHWTVAVVEGEPRDKSGLEKFPVQFGKFKIDSAVVRGVKAENNNNQGQTKIDIRAIVASRQEFIDLDQATIKNMKDKQDIRNLRPKEKGMLLIYPLHPKVKVFESLSFNFSEKMVPIGIAISFPNSELDDSKIYEVNKTIK